MEGVIAFIVTNLPLVLCLLVGIALLVVEVFVPGFGIPGICGSILLILGIVMTFNTYGTLAGLGVTIVALALAGLSVSMSLKSAATGKISKSELILRDTMKPEEDHELEAFIGKEGVTMTVLRPAGIAEFDGVRLNVVTEGNFVSKDVKVCVSHVEGTKIVVKEVGA